MTWNELLKNRRSIRNYKDTPVSMEIIQELIHESTIAPSAGNSQPWKFIIVNNKDMMKRMSDESKKNILARIAVNPDDPAKNYKTMLEKEDFNVFYNAQCMIIILGESDCKNLDTDCALAASYFMMSAVSKGLGTCWVNLGMFIEDPDLKKELGLEEKHRIVAPIILGYPEMIPAAAERREAEIVKVVG